MLRYQSDWNCGGSDVVSVAGSVADVLRQRVEQSLYEVISLLGDLQQTTNNRLSSSRVI